MPDLQPVVALAGGNLGGVARHALPIDLKAPLRDVRMGIPTQTQPEVPAFFPHCEAP
jgi:hypothetical protein